MRIHTLEATGGQVYSEMPRFLDKNGKPTSDEAQAAKDPATGAAGREPRDVLGHLHRALDGAQHLVLRRGVGVFGIVMGIALLLVGIGFLVLVLGGIERKPAST